MGKYHSCEYPECINLAFETCKKCFHWFCKKHLNTHSCKKMDAWSREAPKFNALFDGVIRYYGPMSGVPPEKPTRKEWRKIIDR